MSNVTVYRRAPRQTERQLAEKVRSSTWVYTFVAAFRYINLRAY